MAKSRAGTTSRRLSAKSWIRSPTSSASALPLAALAYGLGMRGTLDVIVLIYFVACGISRLARYNVTAGQLADTSGKVKYFEGTPIPSSLILVAVLALCVYFGRADDNLPLGVVEIGGARWHPLSLLFFVNGSMMISKTLRIPKF